MNYKIKIDILEIERKNYHLFIDIFIGDIPCRLLLDTGASKTVFDSIRVLRFVKENKVKRDDAKSVGLGAHEVETHSVKLKMIQIGKFTLPKLEAAVLSLNHVNATYKTLNIPEIDGVLGSDFLMKHEAIIDYRKAVLKIKE